MTSPDPQLVSHTVQLANTVFGYAVWFISQVTQTCFVLSIYDQYYNFKHFFFNFHFQGCGTSCGKCDCSGVKGTKVRCNSFSYTYQLSLLISFFFFHLPNRLVFSRKVFSQAKASLLPVSFLPRGVGSAGRTGTGSGWGPVMEQEQISV